MDAKSRRYIATYAFPVTLLLAVVIIVTKAVLLGQAMEQRFVGMGNDDIMRLTVVRDLIAGQSWFDQTQYRVVPPDGLDLHWSRYVDAGIAAIIIPLSWFLPMQDAEFLGVVIWPTVILLMTAIVVGLGAKRVFGPTAACFALASLVFWPLTADLHARPGNLDHHNVQFLTSVSLLLAVIWPEGRMRAGIVGGVVAAFSLAVGLESLPFLILAGAVLLVQAASDRAQHFDRLKGFCLALAVASVVFWLGQASTEYRFAVICDQLGIPVLTLVAIAVASSLLPFLILGSRSKLWSVLGMTTALTAFGFAVAWPVVGICVTGPYGALPAYIQEYISSSIIEARPGLVYAQSRPSPAVLFVLPVFAATVLGLVVAFSSTQSEGRDRAKRQAMLVLIVFASAGLGLTLYQMRMVNLAAAPVPLLAGAIMAVFLKRYVAERSAGAAAALLLGAFLMVVPTVFVTAIAPYLPQGTSTGGASKECRSYDAMQSLNAVPPAKILATGNYGPVLIAETHHFALSALYHRSEESLANVIRPFTSADADVAGVIRDTGADLLLLCKEHELKSDVLNAVVAGASVPWLRPVPLESDVLMLFEILP